MHWYQKSGSVSTVLGAAGALGTFIMLIFPDLVTQDEAATLGTNVPIMVTSTIAVISTIVGIVRRATSKKESSTTSVKESEK